MSTFDCLKCQPLSDDCDVEVKLIAETQWELSGAVNPAVTVI